MYKTKLMCCTLANMISTVFKVQVLKTYWLSRKYVNPTKGNWFPAKAFGVGNVSTSPLSSSISSKLLVSMSLLNSGTTGAAAMCYTPEKRD